MNFKKVKVVMLATNSKESSAILLGVTKYHSVLTKSVLHDLDDWMKHGKGQHLHFLSNDEPKLNDWCLEGLSPLAPTELIRVTIEDLERCVENYHHGSCKKIVATTDINLIYTQERTERGKFDNFSFEDGWYRANFKRTGVEDISQDFIEEYIAQYNNGNTITHTMVEYAFSEYHNQDRVFTDDKGVVNVTKIKDSYTKKELSEILLNHTSDMFEALSLKPYPKETLMNYTKQYIEKL